MNRSIIILLVATLVPAACKNKATTGEQSDLLQSQPKIETEDEVTAEVEQDESTGSPCASEAIEGFFASTPEGAIRMAGKVCEYPDDMKEMLDALGNASPEHRLSLVVKYIVTDISSMENVCTGAEGVLRGLAEIAYEEKPAWLYDSCKFGNLDLATKDEMSKVTPSVILATTIVFGWMKGENVDRAKKICRHMMGLE